MSSLSELLKKYVNTDYDELLALANYNFGFFKETLDKAFGKDDAATAVMVIFSACTGVDGKLTQLEYKFIRDFTETDVDYDTVLAMVSALGDAKGRELADKIVDALNDDQKSNLLSFCLCFLAVDETISRDEIDFLIKLMN